MNSYQSTAIRKSCNDQLLILASKSPRRHYLLTQAGLSFSVIPSDFDENTVSMSSPENYVRILAEAKADDVSNKYPESWVIGADTIVLLGRRLIGKPKTRKEAIALLKAFSGREILVYTGLYVIDIKRGRSAGGIDVSRVYVKTLSRKKIDRFVKIAGPHDKAGGFSIEGPGAFIFDNIEGSFYNILGLPMMKLNELFERLGVDLLG